MSAPLILDLISLTSYVKSTDCFSHHHRIQTGSGGHPAS